MSKSCLGVMSVALLSWLCAATSLTGQSTFQKVYGGTEDDFGLDLVLADSGYVIAGSTFSAGIGGRDATLLKIDLAGNVVWQRTYGGFDADQFTQVTRGNDGGFLAVGDTYSQGAGNSDFWLVKTDNNGNVVWTKTIGGAFEDLAGVEGRILPLSNGYVVSFGQRTTTLGGSYSTTVVRLDNAGNVLWEKAYSTAALGTLFSVGAVSPTEQVLYASGGAEAEGALLQLDAANGNVLFSRLYAGFDNEALYNVFTTLDSNLILSDQTWSAGNGTFYGQWLLKTTLGGDILWSKVYTQPGASLRGVVIPTSDSGYFSIPFNPLTVTSNANMVKLNANGGIQWAYCFGGENADRFIKGLETPDGGYIAVGQSAGNGTGGTDILVVKVNADGLVEGCCKKALNLEVQDFAPEVLDGAFGTSDYPAPLNASADSESPVTTMTEFCSQSQPVLHDTIALCPNEPYDFNGTTFFAPDEVISLIPGVGCDTALVTHFILRQYVVSDFGVQTFCPGGSVTINGVVYDQPGTVMDTLTNNNGLTCDTIGIYTIVQLDNPTLSVTVGLCPGEFVVIGGIVYSQPGVVNGLLPSTTGCDTLVTYTLVAEQQVVLSDTIEFCAGDTILINGQAYTESGTVQDTIASTTGGCDTLATYNLIMLPLPTLDGGDIGFCSGDTVYINGQAYTESGDVTQIIASTTGGCDTLATYHLFYLQQPLITNIIEFCPGDSIVIGGVAYTQDAFVTEIVPSTTGGCDTLVSYVLTLLPQPAITQVITFCPGSSVTINGQTYDQPGVVFDTIPALSGCDTLAIYDLQFAPQPTIEQTYEFCAGGSVVINGETYTQAGTVTDTIASTTGGCDTIATYTLVVLPDAAVSQTVEFCAGSSVVIDGVTYTQAGTVIDTIASAAGCDTIITYTLVVLALPTIEQTYEFCAGGSVVINGETYTQAGTVTDTIASTTGGCDTIATYTLIVLPFAAVSQTVEFCAGDSVVIDGQTYTQAGTVIDTIAGAPGFCDSVVTYTLIVLPQPTLTQTIFLCPGDTIVLGGQTYTQPGTVQVTLASTTGACDTLATYTLLLAPNSPTLDLGPDVTLCSDVPYTFNAGSGFATYLWQDGSTDSTFVADAVGAYSVQVTDACGITQQDTVNLTYSLLGDTQFPDDTLCIGGSLTLNLPGFDTYNWAPSAGLSCTDCDSVVVQPDVTTTYTVQASTVDGCVLNDTFTIVVVPLPTIAQTIEFCMGSSVTINGQVYTNSGTVTDTLPSSTGGCDTVATYTLFEVEPPVLSQTITFCAGSSVVIGGQTYTQAGTVVDTIPSTTGGCDTIATYTLVALPLPTTTQTIEFCAGDTVLVNGQAYTQPDTVTVMIASTTGGCDTLATYVLQYFAPSGPTAVSIACPASISVDATSGASFAAVSYATPATASDCPCPGITLDRTQGLPSGSNFPIGATQVCYTALDYCENSATCCFTVTVNAVDTACDVKVIGCMKYEIIGISKNAAQEKTYRIRVTNNCANKQLYTVIQLPDGVAAVSPANASTYTSPTGRTYTVRNPNASPFYSIRFKSVSDSISGGEFDVFEYTLPPQSNPLFIHIASRLDNQAYYEAHLNVFDCPVTTSNNVRTRAYSDRLPANLNVFPNPISGGTLFADLSDWTGQTVQVRIHDTQGRAILMQAFAASDHATAIDLPAGLSSGIYFLEVAPADGSSRTVRFTVQW